MGDCPRTCKMISSVIVILSLCSSLAFGGVVVGPKVVRVPSQDSAIIQHHRLGGNFAYSVAEAHAFGVQTPIVEQRVVPTGVSFHHGVPQVRTHNTVVKQQVPQFGIVKTQHTVPVQIPAVRQSPVNIAAVQQQHILPASTVQLTGVQQPFVQQYSGAIPTHVVSSPVIGHHAVPVVQLVTSKAEDKKTVAASGTEDKDAVVAVEAEEKNCLD